jgi:hypothetical protein
MARIGAWRLLLIQHANENDERCGSDRNLLKTGPSPRSGLHDSSGRAGATGASCPALEVPRFLRQCVFPVVRPLAPGCSNCSNWVPNMTFWTAMVAVRCDGACTGIFSMVQTNHSCLPPKGKPEFHAEWLRDGPCDATTTCLGNPGAWCQLLPGDGEHEIRGLLPQSSR